MTNEDIIRMAREAGGGPTPPDFLIPVFERFAALVASAERERILDICKEGLWDAEGIRYHLDNQNRGQA